MVLYVFVILVSATNILQGRQLLVAQQVVFMLYYLIVSLSNMK